MQRFRYHARTSQGKSASGVVEASDTKHAVALLRERGLIVTKIGPENQLLKQLNSLLSGVNLNTLANFTRQLATMINSGLTLVDSILILENQNSSSMKTAISKVRREIESGQSLSNALSSQPKVFDQVYVSLVRAGEAGGLLDQVLLKLAENLEKKREFQSKVKGALLYPIIILLGMIAVIFVMLIYVIPQLADLYEDFEADLPIITQLLIDLSDFTVKFWWLIAAGAGLLVVSWAPINKNPQIRKTIEKTWLAFPVFGPLREQIIMATMVRTLSLLITAGVPIVESLNLCAKITGSKLYEEATNNVARLVEKGFSLAQGFGQQDQFPPIITQMLTVGEETGKVDQLLEKVSIYFQTESEQKVKNLTTAIEPLILIFLGVGVGFLIFAIVMPIYNLTTIL